MTTEAQTKYSAVIKQFFSDKQRSALEAKIMPLERDWKIDRNDFDKIGNRRSHEEFLAEKRANPLSQKTEQNIVDEIEAAHRTKKTTLIDYCDQACGIRNSVAKEVGEAVVAEARKIESDEKKVSAKFGIDHQPSPTILRLREIAAELSRPKRLNSTEHSPRSIVAEFLDA
jgi:hypothetical protein